MKKLESSLKNMALALTGFSVVAGAILGWVNEVTAEPIAQANAKTLSDAIAVVVPGFDNNPAEAPETIDVDGVSYKIYKATKGGEFIGAAVESSSMGFGGELKVLVVQERCQRRYHRQESWRSSSGSVKGRWSDRCHHSFYYHYKSVPCSCKQRIRSI